MKRILLIALILLIVCTVPTIASAATPKYCEVDAERCWKGHGAEYWHWQYKLQKKENKRLAKTRRYNTFYAIRLASVVTGVPYRDIYNVARCETGGTFSPFADNPHSTASGVMQFLTSTWNAYPLSQHFSIWDPVANVMQAALIARDEGWRQWVCKP